MHSKSTLHAGPTLKQQRDELLQAILPFARLLQSHNDKGPDYMPFFAVNDAVITIGDLRRACVAVYNTQPKKKTTRR